MMVGHGESAIYYVASSRGPGARILSRFDLSSGESQSVADASATPYQGGLAIASDASSLLWVRIDRSESDVMLAEIGANRN